MKSYFWLLNGTISLNVGQYSPGFRYVVGKTIHYQKNACIFHFNNSIMDNLGNKWRYVIFSYFTCILYGTWFFSQILILHFYFLFGKGSVIPTWFSPIFEYVVARIIFSPKRMTFLFRKVLTDHLIRLCDEFKCLVFKLFLSKRRKTELCGDEISKTTWAKVLKFGSLLNRWPVKVLQVLSAS